jgi:hypothetical protein
MAEMTPFQYGGFWDVPRYLTLRYRGRRFLLQCPFDEDFDKYPMDYSVYVVPESNDDTELVGILELLSNAPMACIGQIPIDRVRFDASKRQELDASVVDDLIAEQGLAG